MFHYEVLGTNVVIDFILFLDKPMQHHPIGVALLNAKRWLEDRLKEKGDDWLAVEDEPFVTTVLHGCWLRIDSIRAPNGRSRMTYRTLQSVFDGLWNVLYLLRNNSAGSIRIKVANILAGHGAVSVEPPEPETVTASKERSKSQY